MSKPLHTLTETLPDGTSFEMVPVEGGSFMMGSEEGKEREKPTHKVQLASFYLSRYPITQLLWKAVMGEDPKKLAFPHPQRPVEMVSWHEVVEFCNQINKIQDYRTIYTIDKDLPYPNNKKWTDSLIKEPEGFRLPTEAEWEYAAGGGKYGPSFTYAGSPNHNEVAWWDRSSQGISQPIGLRSPNALGLFGMSGNIWEWVWDWYDDNYYEYCSQQAIIPNPIGKAHGSSRGVRGGSWYNYVVDDLRIAYRYDYNPAYRNLDIGFRLCRSLAP